MSKKSRTKRAKMTKKIGHAILDSWDLIIDWKKTGKAYNKPTGIAFNTDVSNNKRRMKIRIYIQG
jgi:hypothetical protein